MLQPIANECMRPDGTLWAPPTCDTLHASFSQKEMKKKCRLPVLTRALQKRWNQELPGTCVVPMALRIDHIPGPDARAV